MVITESDNLAAVVNTHNGSAVSEIGDVAVLVDHDDDDGAAAAFIGGISRLGKLFELDLCFAETVP